LTTTVMIVDDSRVSRMMLQMYAKELRPDWQFLEAASGDAALLAASGRPIDLIVMDVNMPGMNGLDAAAALKASLPKATVVMLTANVQQSTRNKAEEIGLHFVEKPITAEVTAHIISLLGATDV